MFVCTDRRKSISKEIQFHAQILFLSVNCVTNVKSTNARSDKMTMLYLRILDGHDKEVSVKELTDVGREMIRADCIELLRELEG